MNEEDLREELKRRNNAVAEERRKIYDASLGVIDIMYKELPEYITKQQLFSELYSEPKRPFSIVKEDEIYGFFTLIELLQFAKINISANEMRQICDKPNANGIFCDKIGAEILKTMMSQKFDN